MRNLLATAALATALSLTPIARAHAGELTCTLDFNMAGWSAIYKRTTGNGVVRCDNGASLPVHIEGKGGGLTVGTSRIRNGHGRFTGVNDIRDVLGGYATGEANAAAGPAAKAQVVTKGPVSLALAGRGEGVELGVSFGSFIISEAGTRRRR